MDSLYSLKKEIMDKKSLINQLIVQYERITAPELVNLSTELDTLLNRLLIMEKTYTTI
ncbi:MAG: Spo0E family sporulation regulatory protein-aspartic acid phosphatase [Clostridia bacterium]|nr:Spo0E family sporulation regulatory protein-aspartic acid phosphatase [Clostridia bacterium]